MQKRGVGGGGTRVPPCQGEEGPLPCLICISKRGELGGKGGSFLFRAVYTCKSAPSCRSEGLIGEKSQDESGFLKAKPQRLSSPTHKSPSIIQIRISLSFIFHRQHERALRPRLPLLQAVPLRVPPGARARPGRLAHPTRVVLPPPVPAGLRDGLPLRRLHRLPVYTCGGGFGGELFFCFESTVCGKRKRGGALLFPPPRAATCGVRTRFAKVFPPSCKQAA